MSCKTRTELETAVDAAFSDLIDNTALACEQINTEGKHDLFMMAGRIGFTHTSGSTTVAWKTANDRTINAGALSIITSPNRIKIEYPAFTAGKIVRPISVLATPGYSLITYNSVNAGYKLGTEASSVDTRIDISRNVQLSGILGYSTANNWYIVGASPLPTNAFLGASFNYNTTTGELEVTLPMPLKGVPVLTPMTDASGNLYIPYVTPSLSANTFKVFFYDLVTGNKMTGTPYNGLICNLNVGEVDQEVDISTTNFGFYGDIFFQGIYQMQTP